MEEMKKIYERIEKLESHTQKIHNIFWVVGILAVIFGVSGGWGIFAIKNSKEQITKLQQQIDGAQDKFSALRKAEEEKFIAFVEGQKESAVQKINLTVNSFSNSVIAFEADGCPQGWVEYTKGYGRFIRGLDKSGESIDPDGQRGPGDLQEGAIEAHQHSLRDSGKADWDGNQYDSSQRVAHGTDSGRRIKTSFTGENETRPKNVALLFCQKVS